jgi:SulP family sulfate permease
MNLSFLRSNLLRRTGLLAAILAGLVNGVLIVIFQSAYSALIFSDKLVGFASLGMGIMLAGAIAIGTVVSIFSSYPGSIAAPQDAPSAILATVIGSALYSSTLPAEASLLFAVTLIAATALVTGLNFILLGFFNLGNLVRFIPYPVVGGFLAGTGFVLVKGAVGILLGSKISIDSLNLLANTSFLIKFVPAFLFATVVILLMNYRRHTFTIPASIIISIALFYSATFLTGLPISYLENHGWLMSQFKNGANYQPILWQTSAAINWQLLWQSAGEIISISIICVISLLLNASGLELISRSEVDLNRELKITGFANIFSGLVGSSVGYLSLSLTALANHIGSRSRLTGLIAVLVCLITLIFGLSLPAYFPRPLLAGLLLYLGLIFLKEWLYNAWFKLPKSEYPLILVILIVIANWGFLPGMGAGLVFSVMLFALQYSRINVAKHQFTRRNFHSNVDRSAKAEQCLRENGDSVLILILQGYLFFGTTNQLVKTIRNRISQKDISVLQYVLLDFRLVNGLDSSALNGFAKLQILAQINNFVIVFSNVAENIRDKLAAVSISDGSQSVRFFPDLDHGLEWVEDEMLQRFHTESLNKGYTYPEIIQQIFGDEMPKTQSDTSLDIMRQFFEEREIPKDQVLIRQNDPPVGIYFVMDGIVSAEIRSGNGDVIRLRKMLAGTVIGEMSVYLNRPATANVVTHTPCKVLFLSIERLREMEAQQPYLSTLFHKFILKTVSERLSYANQIVKTFQH